jgi:RNA polymerase sigma-70 factor (ECF subfamily)
MADPRALAGLLFADGEEPCPRDLDEAASALAGVRRHAELAWPGVEVEAASFVRYLAARRPADLAPVAALAALHTADLYLACACLAGGERALAALEATFFDEHDAALARLSPGRDFADEVKQAAREKLLVRTPEGPPRLVEYSGRGALGSFLRVVIMREALSLRRRERRDAPGSDEAPAQCDTADPELLHLRRTYAAEFERAFREAVAGLTSEERNILRYHYVDRLNIDHVGAIYGIHRVSAARRLTKIRAALVERTRGHLAERLRLDGAELRSVLRLIQSQVDISLRSALADAPVVA